MRKLNRPAGDSLELLLDTLCNVFGGIILVACLLALLARERNGTPTPILTASQGMLLERRLEAAQAEIKGLTQLLVTLNQAGDGPLRELAAERDQLKETLATLRSDKEARTKITGEIDQSDPAAALVQLRAQVKEARQRIADAESRAEAGQAKERDLLARLEALKEQTRNTEAGQVQTLRFPKEKKQTRASFYIIVKMEEAFPLYGADGGIFSGLIKENQGSDGFRVTPRRGQGLDPATNPTALRSALDRCQRSGAYVSLLVFPDSFETFRAVKDMIISSGLEYGLRVFPEGEELTFGTGGSSPPPL